MSFREGMNNVLGGLEFVQQGIAQGEQRRKTNGLAALMGDYAATGQADLRGIAMNGGNPLAVRNDKQDQEVAKHKKGAQLAAMLVSAPEAMRPQVWSQIAPQLNALGLPVSAEYSPDFLPLAEQYAQQFGGGSGTSGNIQSTFVGADGMRYGVTRDGRTMPLGMNAPNNQIIDTGNGFYGVNKGNLSAAPVMVGQGPQTAPQPPQAPPSGTYQTPQGIVRLADDLSPEQREAAMMDMANGGNQSQVTLPPRNVAPQQFGSGQQLRSAPKPQAPSELDRRLALADQIGATDDEKRGMITGVRPESAADMAKRAASEQKLKAQSAKAKSALTATESTLDSTIAEARAIRNSGNLGGVTGLGAIGGSIPGTGWANTKARLKTLMARSAFGTLQEMRNNSPTGGALGSVSERELDLLQNAATALDTAQSPEALQQSLDRYIEVLQGSKSRLRNAYDETFGDNAPADASPAAGNNIDSLLEKYK